MAADIATLREIRVSKFVFMSIRLHKFNRVFRRLVTGAWVCCNRERSTIASCKRFVPFGKTIDVCACLVVSRLTKSAALSVGQEHFN